MNNRNERIFIIGDRALRWGGYRWINKKGVCARQELSCEKRNADVSCFDNLSSHCCKHVVHGSENEKDRFLEATRDKTSKIEMTKDDLFLNNNVIRKYEDLSRRIIDDSVIVGLSAGMRKEVNFYCVGNNDTAGFVDYLSYFEYNKSVGGYGIVSTFYKNVDIDSYWMLKVVDEYCNNKSICIKGEAIKRIFDRKQYDFEPVDCINAAFQRINYLCSPGTELDEKNIGLSALYMFYHDKVTNNNENDFYKTITSDENLSSEKAKKFIQSNEEKITHNMFLLYIELFYKDTLSFKSAYPSEYNEKNKRIMFDKYPDFNNEGDIAIMVKYCARIMHVIESNIFSSWEPICDALNSNIDTVLTGFTSYDVARRFVTYFVCVLNIWKIKGDKILDLGIDMDYISKLQETVDKGPTSIKKWWNIYDSFLDLNNNIIELKKNI